MTSEHRERAIEALAHSSILRHERPGMTTDQIRADLRTMLGVKDHVSAITGCDGDPEKAADRLAMDFVRDVLAPCLPDETGRWFAMSALRGIIVRFAQAYADEFDALGETAPTVEQCVIALMRGALENAIAMDGGQST